MPGFIGFQQASQKAVRWFPRVAVCKPEIAPKDAWQVSVTLLPEAPKLAGTLAL
jgi:hypothetical protein